MPEEGDSRGMEGAPPRGPRCHQGFSPDGCAYRRRGFEKAPRRLLEGSWKRPIDGYAEEQSALECASVSARGRTRSSRWYSRSQ